MFDCSVGEPGSGDLSGRRAERLQKDSNRERGEASEYLGTVEMVERYRRDINQEEV